MKEVFPVGRVIKEKRLKKGLNLTQFSKITGFSVGYLSKIENGKADPSISSCRKIAKALNLRMSELFGEIEKEGILTVVRKDERSVIAREGSDIGYSYEAQVPNFYNRLMDPYVITDYVISNERPDFQHEGQEMIYVLKGKVMFHHNGNEMILNEGDCVYFDANYPHGGRQLGETQAKMLLIYCNNDQPSI